MNVDGYLRRIGSTGTLRCDMETLRELQYRHVMAIPFETFDIHHQVPIILQINLLYQKVIRDNRGGYCYELNMLFHHLLGLCGFDARLVAGRLHHGNSRYGMEFEHMAMIVELDGTEWLVDVGYGDFSLVPLAVTPGEIQTDGRNYFQILDQVIVDGAPYLPVARWNGSKQDFKIDYLFSRTPRAVAEFEGMNHFHQTSADSHFSRSLICTLPTPGGRITMINNKLIRRENGNRQVKIIQNEDHREQLLEKYFHMDMVYLL